MNPSSIIELNIIINQSCPCRLFPSECPSNAESRSWAPWTERVTTRVTGWTAVGFCAAAAATRRSCEKSTKSVTASSSGAARSSVRRAESPRRNTSASEPPSEDTGQAGTDREPFQMVLRLKEDALDSRVAGQGMMGSVREVPRRDVALCKNHGNGELERTRKCKP